MLLWYFTSNIHLVKHWGVQCHLYLQADFAKVQVRVVCVQVQVMHILEQRVLELELPVTVAIGHQSTVISFEQVHLEP